MFNLYYWRERVLRDFHWPLFHLAVLISLVGVVAIYSASHEHVGNYAAKQLVWLTISVFALFAVVWLGYRRLLGYSYAFYTISIGLLLGVMVLGDARLGAQRWIEIGPFVLQPSEFAKVAVILTLAQYLGERARNRYQTKRFLVAFMLVAFPMVFILKQPDLGTTLIFIPILFCILFLWGVRLRYLVVTSLCALGSFPVFWMLLKEYQRSRLLVFLNPNIDPLGAGYTAVQSKIAVGAGQLLGKGYFQGTQNRLRFLPEHHTDFIFCVIAEEWGFVGVCLILLLFALLLLRMIRVIERTSDTRARLIAAGVVSMIFFQVVVNIGMTIGLMPITGLPLPFVSYGGSSLLTMFFAIGLLISIYKDRSIF